MVDPIGPQMPPSVSWRRPGPEAAGAADHARRDFQALAVACRALAGAGPSQITRISVSLPAGDDLDGPDLLADMALSLAGAHGFEAQVEIGRGWVTVFFSRREEGL